VNQLLLQYSYLQVLDFLTTVASLLHGVKEANPLGGLLLVKVVAVGLGLYCWRLGKQRLLLRMNLLFAVIVAWNVAALIVS
jgi:hypothetical protein